MVLTSSLGELMEDQILLNINDRANIYHLKVEFSSRGFLGLVWFGLVCLFDGIPTFMVYLMPKPFLQRDSSDTI